jgi:hypothetical protein
MTSRQTAADALGGPEARTVGTSNPARKDGRRQRRITRSHVRTMNSQFIGVPFLTSRAARLPSTSPR